MSNDRVWVFGYGSLMWNPGFAHAERAPALLHGYHRALCIYSYHHRGTRKKPGLVLGLDQGGSCRGIAFAVEKCHWPEVHAYLDAREMPVVPGIPPEEGAIYEPRQLSLSLPDRKVTALCYVVRRGHPQYSGRLSPDESARLVRQGEGQSGTSRDYLTQTVAHLDALGIPDGPLHQLLRLVG
ncbi:gamma-glutamylcyclotransferase [Magnetospira sp. QH-2]|uniref:gamma-glutamylcyclotransferase n=1 Tax=Magnetospira sp. (strain QH-2) TaxID=1288970 RepID=UPI0003E816BA|nr:gamma-glutamylcyclotransferase [Magnetospira sp. QH-2]CCQ74823.1 putative chaC-like cation transporter [Magnetospira sp. QH-2]